MLSHVIILDKCHVQSVTNYHGIVLFFYAAAYCSYDMERRGQGAASMHLCHANKLRLQNGTDCTATYII